MTKACLLLLLAAPFAAGDAGRDQQITTLRHEIAELRGLLDAIPEPGQEPRQLHDGLITQAALTSMIDARSAATDTDAADIGAAMDSAWLILCGALVLFMHAGFAMLETGCSRYKNAQNVLLKNLVNICVGTVGWWLFGWGFAYGGPYDAEGKLENTFIGGKEFAASGFLSTDAEGNVIPYEDGPTTSKMLGWFFQWAFCTAAATIVSGGVCERVKSPTYAAFAFVMASFIYPVVVAWTWGYGWISSVADIGFMDFAGSGVVHLTGGVAALAGTAVLGPRKDVDGKTRFEAPAAFQNHNLPLVVLGTLILWFGWYGFNCGSTLSMHDQMTGALGAQVAMNTTISAACGGMMSFIIAFAMTKQYDVGALCNGILGGLVSITAGCGNMEAGSAMGTGLVGGIVYQAASVLLQKAKIDDPVDAFPVHGACGIWGVIAVGLFDWGNGFDHYHGWSGFNCMTDADGNCQEGVGGKGLGAQIVLALAVTAWSGGLSAITFKVLMLTGKLRIDPEVEEMGMDMAHHSPQKAYAISPAAQKDVEGPQVVAMEAAEEAKEAKEEKVGDLPQEGGPEANAPDTFAAAVDETNPVMVDGQAEVAPMWNNSDQELDVFDDNMVSTEV